MSGALGLQDLAVDVIDAGHRLRPVDADWVEALAGSLADRGLDAPILVRPAAATSSGPEFVLVAGAHRLAAARLLGWLTIKAEVRALADLEARLAEIDENLVRRELGPLDRALFLAERKRVWDELHPSVRHGGNRTGDGAGKSQALRLAPLHAPHRFTKEAAQKLGLSERTIQLAVELARGLTPEAIALLRDTPAAKNANLLLRLSREEPGDQARKAAALRLGERVYAAAAAPPDAFASFRRLWDRADETTRRRIRDHVGAGT